MTEAFADTNLFIRWAVSDDSVQADAVGRVFEKVASGDLRLHVTPLVIAEIAWVLDTSYRFPKNRIRDFILTIVSTPGVETEDAGIVLEAALLFSDQNIDFVDAYHLCWMPTAGLDTALTFDQKHFSRVPRVTVVVPK